MPVNYFAFLPEDVVELQVCYARGVKMATNSISGGRSLKELLSLPDIPMERSEDLVHRLSREIFGEGGTPVAAGRSFSGENIAGTRAFLDVPGAIDKRKSDQENCFPVRSGPTGKKWPTHVAKFICDNANVPTKHFNASDLSLYKRFKELGRKEKQSSIRKLMSMVHNILRKGYTERECKSSYAKKTYVHAVRIIEEAGYAIPRR